MKEPKRWRDFDGGADADIRSLLLNSPALNPSRSEAKQIWSSLSAQLDVTFAAPGPQGSQAELGRPASVHGPQVGHAVAAAGAGSAAGKVTLAVVLLAMAGGVLGVRMTASHDGRVPAPKESQVEPYPSPPPQSTHSPEPAVQPSAAATAPATAAPESRSRPERPAHPRSAIRPTSTLVSVNALLEEGRRLDRARTALRAHDPDLALQLLEANAEGTTELAQEREALTIEALAAKPALHSQATERARVFMRAFPNSPYRERIKAIVFDGE
jgi:hypothetical protein